MLSTTLAPSNHRHPTEQELPESWVDCPRSVHVSLLYRYTYFDTCFSFELVVNAPSLTRARFGQQPWHGSLVLPAACFY